MELDLKIRKIECLKIAYIKYTLSQFLTIIGTTYYKYKKF